MVDFFAEKEYDIDVNGYLEVIVKIKENLSFAKIENNQEENKELSKTYYEEEKTRVITPQEVAQIRKTLEPKEEVYDPYDDVVTKDELIDAINDKDPKKLKILYEQDE